MNSETVRHSVWGGEGRRRGRGRGERGGER